MEKEHTHKEIELRSEEVQEVMNRVPAWILRSGITVLFVIVVALVAGSYWFKYPDVIAAEVTVSTQDPGLRSVPSSRKTGESVCTKRAGGGTRHEPGDNREYSLCVGCILLARADAEVETGRIYA